MQYIVFLTTLLFSSISFANSPPEIFTDFVPPQVIHEGDTISFKVWATDPDGDDISEIYVTRTGIEPSAGHYISYFDGESVQVFVMKIGGSRAGEICFGVNESHTEAMLSDNLCIFPVRSSQKMVFCDYQTIALRFKVYATSVGMKPGFLKKIDSGSAKAQEGVIFYGDINELQFVANSIGCESCKPKGRMGGQRLNREQQALLFAHWGDWNTWSAWFTRPSIGIPGGVDGPQCIDEGWSLIYQ